MSVCRGGGGGKGKGAWFLVQLKGGFCGLALELVMTGCSEICLFLATGDLDLHGTLVTGTTASGNCGSALVLGVRAGGGGGIMTLCRIFVGGPSLAVDCDW